MRKPGKVETLKEHERARRLAAEAAQAAAEARQVLSEARNARQHSLNLRALRVLESKLKK